MLFLEKTNFKVLAFSICLCHQYRSQEDHDLTAGYDQTAWSSNLWLDCGIGQITEDVTSLW